MANKAALSESEFIRASVASSVRARKDTPRPLMVRQPVSLPQAAETYQLINSRQLREIFPASLMSFWRWEKQGKWPKRIKRFGRNYWLLSEVMEAIDDMADE